MVVMKNCEMWQLKLKLLPPQTSRKAGNEERRSKNLSVLRLRNRYLFSRTRMAVISVAKGPAPPNRNASNDKFVRKKIIVASDFLIVFFVRLRRLFLGGGYLILRTKSALRSVKTFFFFAFFVFT